jgi:prophage maintenance system killer protein
MRAAGLLLRRNGSALVATQEELFSFTMRMATGEADLITARDWLARHTG